MTNSFRHLRLVDENFRPHYVEASIDFDEQSGRYSVELEQFGRLLETRSGKAHAKRDLTLWFESIDGEKPRIPWARIARGERFQARVLMRETFFEKNQFGASSSS